MPLPITNFKNFLRDASLQRQGGLGGYGLRHGYPVNFRFLGADMRSDALISVRLAGVPTAAPSSFGPPLEELLARREAEFSVQGDQAHLLLRDGKKRFSHGEVLPSLDALLHALQASGLGPQQTCGSCRSTEELTVLSDGIHAGWICPSCLARQTQRHQHEHGFVLASLPKLLVAAAVVMVGIALDWALVGIGVDRLFEWLGGSFRTSTKLMVLLALLLGAAIALPALAFKAVARRGTLWPVLLALLAATGGVLLGEVLHADWLHWRSTQQLVLLPTWPELRALLTGGNDFFLFLRLLLAVTVLFTAAMIARSPKRQIVV
ncbi:MAG: hypothetical protein JSR82_23590 [Verrucomicrobia bacterium]|nr:hypothetical protein [Verrucomicrobiota bacterium]